MFPLNYRPLPSSEATRQGAPGSSHLVQDTRSFLSKTDSPDSGLETARPALAIAASGGWGGGHVATAGANQQ